MEFGILGPLEVRHGGRPVALGGGKLRALLAIFVLHANEPISAERLASALWGDEAPVGAVGTVRAYVSRLRRTLDAATGGRSADVIVTRPRGYRLVLDLECLDAHRFERLLAEGRKALAEDQPQRAISALEEALSLWRGRPLDDLAYERFLQDEISRLEGLYVAALEELVDAKLALGRHTEVVEQLETLISGHPYRERLWAQLMLALYRCNRQADALQAYRDARHLLVDALGIEPGQRLRDIERGILAQDPALAVPAMATKVGEGRRNGPRPAGAPATRLVPAPPTVTIGREAERSAIANLLRREETRLVTLTGPGGVGKTRLAIEITRLLQAEFRDGAWFVSLAAAANAEQAARTIVHAIGATSLPGQPPREAIERFLTSRSMLLVLDNFEHLLPAAPLVGDLLAACEQLVVLTTSRQALRLQAERCYPVAPLMVPARTDAAAVSGAAASALFLERARSHDPGFELTEDNAGAIAEICRRLDGLPLAIELAAARTTVLDPRELSTRLTRALDVLGAGPSDAPNRQRTLRATIEWSHRLLTPSEAAIFARFGVFAGGATLDAIEAVTGADLDTLQGLVEKQLLQRHRNGAHARFVMLETVREFALERLGSGRREAESRRRHCLHYLDLAERSEPELFTGREPGWLVRLAAEVDNLRAAFDWGLANEPALALRLAGLLMWFWDIANRVDEGLRWTMAALDAVGEHGSLDDRARARRAELYFMTGKGFGYAFDGSLEAMRVRALEAVALSRQAADPAGIADSLLHLGYLEYVEPLPHPRWRALADEALDLAREAGDARLAARALMHRAHPVPERRRGGDR
jgi:predicted ATPase/DNA-binding SARP family transcriptional activator